MTSCSHQGCRHSLSGAEQLVNVHGKPGMNIASDLHMEHLNKVCKTAIRHTGANICNDTVRRVGNGIGEMDKVMKNFDYVHQLSSKSGKHSSRSAHTDLQRLLKQLHESRVFHCISGWKHTKFSKIVCNSTTNNYRQGQFQVMDGC